MVRIAPNSFGQFSLVEMLGHGGMGTVYKATHPDYEGFVALKVAHRRVAMEAALCRRFEQEFEAASTLRHSRIVAALGYGTEGELPYLVLEYIAGPSLAYILKDRGPLSLEEGVAMFSQIAEALGFIHGCSMVHRDIKPANILIDPSAGAKLADLGLVKDFRSQSGLTLSRIGMGTMEFAPPEQFDDARNVDNRSDIYSLAATLYLALAGRPAFGPAPLATLIKRKLDHQFTPLASLVPGAGEILDQTITRALHPDMARRPSSVGEFVAGIQGKGSKGSRPLLPKLPAPASQHDERRTNVRYAVSLASSCTNLMAVDRTPCPALIMDISAGGVCLELGRRFEMNTLLEVTLPGSAVGEEVILVAMTRWIRSQANNRWMMGCAFTRPLAEVQLDQLLGGDRSQTKLMRK
jgi:serine/threonine-protein kinase